MALATQTMSEGAAEVQVHPWDEDAENTDTDVHTPLEMVPSTVAGDRSHGINIRCACNIRAAMAYPTSNSDNETADPAAGSS